MFFWVNVFTSDFPKICKGNGAGIVVSDKSLFSDIEKMQLIAKEVNLSETAFILKVTEDTYKIRFFTPLIEIDLCGHATIASGHVLFNELNIDVQEIVFIANKDSLIVKKVNDKLSLRLPKDEFTDVSNDDLEKIKKALNVIELKNSAKGSMDILVEIDNEEDIENLEPDLSLLKEINSRGLIVASLSSKKDIDATFRFFAPACGIDEDPATGSAMCLLAPYFKDLLEKQDLKVFQASSRGGYLEVHIHDDFVEVLGNTQTFLKGKIS